MRRRRRAPAPATRLVAALSAPALIIAAPASGSGKTVLTLALLRLLARQGLAVASFKVGPDYIDPGFHAAATGRACFNLDGWAMRPGTLTGLAAAAAEGAQLVIGEGVMGLFDGAVDGTGSTADVAALLAAPVVLVVDVRGQGQSAAAVVAGFQAHRADVCIAGVLFNRVGGPGHEAMLRDALAPSGMPVLGCLPRDAALVLPERHLGLVQAREAAHLGPFMDAAADLLARHLDVDGLRGLARPMGGVENPAAGPPPLAPLGQRIALADDAAFAFSYPHVVAGWRRAGAEITAFSPLADEAPGPGCDAVFLPGGYPELHAGRLAANGGFLDGLRAAANRGAAIYGECGGYMVLGRTLTGADGQTYPMAGLLGLQTSFAERRLHLGYRRLTLAANGPLGGAGAAFRGHEFHYATIVAEDGGDSLFTATDAAGKQLGALGRRAGAVAGSFIHLVDRD